MNPGPLNTIHGFAFVFDMPPQVFDQIGAGPRNWVHKVLAVVYREMLKLWVNVYDTQKIT